MFDLKDLEENFDRYRQAWARRHQADLMALVDGLQQDLKKRKDLIHAHEELLAERNRASQEVAVKKKAGEDVSSLIQRQKEIGPQIKKADQSLKNFQEKFEALIGQLPNIPQESVPDGQSEEQNKELARWGKIPQFNFEPLPHEVLGEKRGWFDFDRAAKLTGARFSVSKASAARLERALIQFMLNKHTSENKYEEVIPPFIVNATTLFGTGNLPKFKDDLFKLEGQECFLIPTAEVPLTNLHADEILSEEDLPKYYTAYTPCFRSEAGSYGKDLKGLIRQHQFNKVELVKIVHPQKSEEEHEKMRRDAEGILEALELPYRTVVLCSGDMGFASTKTYDIEVWLPSQKRYREISSVSNCQDFQARRMKTRFKDSNGKTQHVHSLNGSGLAVGRTLIAILENFQDQEGRVRLPKVLRPYMNEAEWI